MIRISLGFLLVLSLPALLTTCQGETHDHDSRRVYFAGGIKSVLVTTCGDSMQVRPGGEHVPITAREPINYRIAPKPDKRLMGTERIKPGAEEDSLL